MRFLLFAVVIGLAACGSPAREPPVGIVLVTIDTLRADRLGLYGWPRATSPGIDVVAAGSAVFDAAVPTCPATAPSIASILTGAYRGTHRVLANGWKLPPEVETLAEILHARGYRTVGRVTNLLVTAGKGFGQGFDDFGMPKDLVQAGSGMFEGEPLTAEALHLIDGLGGTPFFLWLHYMDPHGPYFPPEPYRQRFHADDYRWPDDHDLPVGTTNFGLGLVPLYQFTNSRTPADYRARYDAEVAYVDGHVARIVEALRARGLWDRTIFVLTADHGESLGEHDYYFQHGWYTYEEAARVPLVIHGPGVPSRRIAASTSLVDLAPTILDLLGLPPGAAMEGRSLRPLFDAGGPDRDAFVQTYYGEGTAMLRTGRWKYVFKPPRPPGPRRSSEPPFPDTSEEWLFDLATDAGELTNLVTTRTDVAHAMRTQLQTWLGEQSRRAAGQTAEGPADGDTPPVRVQGDPQLERQLKALGYVD